MSLATVVHAAASAGQDNAQSPDHTEHHPSLDSQRLARRSQSRPTTSRKPSDDYPSSTASLGGQHKARSHLRNVSVSTPSTRTGPPRSLSFAYSPGQTPAASRSNSKHENGDFMMTTEHGEAFPFNTSDFRSALESRWKDDRKGKKRDSKIIDEPWNPMRWFQESPREEKQGFEFSGADTPSQGPNTTDGHEGPSTGAPPTPVTAPRVPSHLRRVSSVPDSSPRTSRAGHAKWKRLRSLIPHVVDKAQPASGQIAVAPQAVNITDELMTGGLSALMLALWFERNDKGQRRIPILFHRLRIRVSDSIHPLHGHKSVFRIECEYANGAARWVVYRQLRDFISLHGSYQLSHIYNRDIQNLPEFPRTSLPYFKFLRKEGNDISQADFARLQREALESYLVELIRAVMFHPETNRLAGFLEISALSIALAQSGGAQYKAGYLQIESSSSRGGFGRKGASLREKKQTRWCAVRESYLVALEEPGELKVWDVFLLDSDFVIERPKRYYRQGFNLLHPETANEGNHPKASSVAGAASIRSRLSKVFHPLHPRTKSHPNLIEGDGRPSNVTSRSSSSSDSSVGSGEREQLLDPSTNTNPLTAGPDDEHEGFTEDNKIKWDAQNERKKKKEGEVSKHTFYVTNSQMRLKLSARNERQMLQWITALEKVAATSHYTGGNRFDSFAPIRLNVAAQWLVDGRDYFWNLSRAILMARETIYIHDWWISPELQMRRPHKDRYRLDHLLQRKAREGVKIYVIVYQEVSNRTTPTDSNYAKQRLTSLHPNILVQRSPSHFQTGTFYWAHHEKLCVIDRAIAFMGGLDLCFGRWDTPQHVIIDDPSMDPDGSTIWPGKDYSNPRVLDFHTLNKPEEDMYDRTKIPRMPWHDVAMQIVGQPARDLARHFVQRWNFLLRIKNHSRVMPFLLPPPEFKPGELTEMGLTGTCEMQICRSAGPWSMGTPNKVEHSIQNAYLKAIQLSEHFVYIENQFFITSTTVGDVKIENRIGDALVHRIIRAHREGTPWKCCIMIPLIPGFTFPVDHSDGSAIRIILECQNRTIARGPNSIFARLRKEGIDPDDYITVFSLRNWGKLKGGVLTTEQVYIHGKVCIVDDRLAIIGSANINERSQRGDRDSEIAAVIRDTDLMDGTMAGKPFKVGRFAHTLRVRLMREHVGVDVDTMEEDDLMTHEPVQKSYEQDAWDPEDEQDFGADKVTKPTQRTPGTNLAHTTMDGVQHLYNGTAEATAHTARKAARKMGMTKAVNADDAAMTEERTTYTRDGEKVPGFTSSVVPTQEEKVVMGRLSEANADLEGEKGSEGQGNGKLRGDHDGEGSGQATPMQDGGQSTPMQNGGTTPKGESPKANGHANGDASKANGGETPKVNGSDTNNADLRAEDDTLFGAPADALRADDGPPATRPGVNDADADEKAAPAARDTIRRHMAAKNMGSKTWTLPTPRPKVDPEGFEDPVCDEFWKGVWLASAAHNTEIFRKVFHAIPDDMVTTWKQYKDFVVHHERMNKPVRDSESPDPNPVGRAPSETADEGAPNKEGDIADPTVDESGVADDATTAGMSSPHVSTFGDGSGNGAPSKEGKEGGRPRRPTRGAEPFEKWERDEMERLLGELNGHLVFYPTRFLEAEDAANNFLFNADRLLPLPIYD
ncbi:hypothetical protein EV715DRAFT_256257 [Schizophyllum commune]